VFERFTDRARRVVVTAQEEARRLNHNYIGTEHLLLGLVSEGEGVAARALDVLGVPLPVLRARVEDIIGRGNPQSAGHIPFTPGAKKVLELSLREAMQLKHDYIGTEHILLGLIREGQGVGAQVLAEWGASLDHVRGTVLSLLKGATAKTETTSRADVWPAIGDLGTASSEASPAQVPLPTTRCSLCGRPEELVTRMIGARGIVICEPCVTRAHEILTEANQHGGPQRRIRLKPLRDRSPDADERTEAIELAVETAFDPGKSDAERVAAIEDGEHLLATAAALRAAHEGRRAPVDVSVEGVRFVDGGAELTIELWFGGSPAPFRIQGHALRVGGDWKVSRDTFCHLALLAGVPCPPRG
jgi:hypothetical protein